jgi:hypothetical protein
MREVEVGAGEDDGVAEYRLTPHSIHLTSPCNSNSNLSFVLVRAEEDDG